MPLRHHVEDAVDGYVTTSQAASLAGVSVRTIDRYVAADRLTCVRLPSGHRRYRRSDVEALLASA